jgi:hypothetical protein
MVATPVVPADKVKILRDTYHTSLKDPGLLKKLKKDDGSSIQSAARSWPSSPKR